MSSDEKPTQKDEIIQLLRENGDAMGRQEFLDRVSFDESRLDNLFLEMLDAEPQELAKPERGVYDLPERVQKAGADLPAHTEKQVRHYGPASAENEKARTLNPRGIVDMAEGEYRARFGHREPDAVGLFEVVGDSAAPVYFEGEDVPVEVKGDTQEFVEDAIYVFRYEQDVMLKRLRTEKYEKGEAKRIRAESLNPGVDDRILKPNSQNFEVLGRVIDNQKQQLYTSLVGRFLRENGQGAS
jgi:phage repressor protein C with HTH and peptisase S24 domain